MAMEVAERRGGNGATATERDQHDRHGDGRRRVRYRVETAEFLRLSRARVYQRTGPRQSPSRGACHEKTYSRTARAHLTNPCISCNTDNDTLMYFLQHG